MMKYFLSGFFLILISCTAPKNADSILENCIKKSGWDSVKNTELSFSSIGFDFIFLEKENTFEYKVIRKNKNSTAINILSSEGRFNYIDDKKTVVDSPENFDSFFLDAQFFMTLPHVFSKSDEVKQLEYVTSIDYKENAYDVLSLYYKEHQYVLWVNSETQLLDFLAKNIGGEKNNVEIYKRIDSQFIDGRHFSNFQVYRILEPWFQTVDLNKLMQHEKMKEHIQFTTENLAFKRLD